jgi:hypothetical protein
MTRGSSSSPSAADPDVTSELPFNHYAGELSAHRQVLSNRAARSRVETNANFVALLGGFGPGYEWPQSNHGIHVDYKGNVWIGGNEEGRATATTASS